VLNDGESMILNGCALRNLFHYFHDKVGSVTCILPQNANRIRMQLAALDTATRIEDINISGFRLYSLVGAEKSRWSIWFNGNWRVTFEFHDGHTFIIDYEDYH
jgi:proteic killer suppression protein